MNDEMMNNEIVNKVAINNSELFCELFKDVKIEYKEDKLRVKKDSANERLDLVTFGKDKITEACFLFLNNMPDNMPEIKKLFSNGKLEKDEVISYIINSPKLCNKSESKFKELAKIYCGFKSVKEMTDYSIMLMLTVFMTKDFFDRPYDNGEEMMVIKRRRDRKYILKD